MLKIWGVNIPLGKTLTVARVYSLTWRMSSTRVCKFFEQIFREEPSSR